VGCEQFFCRCQQQDNCTGWSSFEPASHGMGNGFSSGRRLYSLIHDLPPIAGPSSTLFHVRTWAVAIFPDPLSTTNAAHGRTSCTYKGYSHLARSPPNNKRGPRPHIRLV
jgi:hypothetical protein